MRTNVSFPSARLELAGHLYNPGDKSGGPLPAIVVGHSAVEKLTGFFTGSWGCRSPAR